MNDQLDIYLNDIGNLNLALFGIGITLFTVVFSFILNKRDELKLVTELIKNGDTSPSLKLKTGFLKSSINKLKSVNKHVLRITIASFFTYFLTKVLGYIDLGNLKNLIFYLTLFLALVIILYSVYMFYIIVKYYSKSIKL